VWERHGRNKVVLKIRFGRRFNSLGTVNRLLNRIPGIVIKERYSRPNSSRITR
jgi:hypothetical protein